MARAQRETVSVDQLNQMQRYLGEEMIEEYQAGLMSRRQMLRRLLGICGSGVAVAALLAACGESSPSTSAPTAGAAPSTAVPPTTASAASTQSARVRHQATPSDSSAQAQAGMTIWRAYRCYGLAL